MKHIERPVITANDQRVAWKSDIAAEMLRRLEIPYVTLNPGASYRGFHDSLVNYLGNESPQMLLCLHEDHVVSIAHGYAKVTDKAMGAILHSNVGLMHGLMGIFNAWCDRMPIFVVGATGPVVPEKRRPWIDWIHTAKDQGALLRDYTKWDDEPRSSHGVVEAFLRGAQIAETTPRGPVYVCLDAGLQEEPVEPGFKLPDASRFRAAPPPGAPAEQIARVAAEIRKAERPLFLFGRGSRTQDDWDRRVRLVEQTGAYVMTSLRERAIFPTEHARHVVPPFAWFNLRAKEIFASADLIVSFDYIDLSGVMRQVDKNASELPATIVHVSQDSVLHNGWSMDYFGLPPADEPIAADADEVVKQLLAALEQDAPRTGTWTGVERETSPAGAFGANADREIIPFDLEVALAEVQKEQQITLAHTNIGWAGTAYQFRDPLDYLGHDGGGGLSAGPGLTIGAALALKDTGRPVVSVLGDGDFLQGATSLWTAAHYGIPALFIVSNNRSNFNDEIHQEAIANVRGRPPENKWIGQRIDDPGVDLASLARAQGVDAEGPVKNVEELRAAIRRGLKSVAEGKPYFIDAHVKPGYAKKILARGD